MYEPDTRFILDGSPPVTDHTACGNCSDKDTTVAEYVIRSTDGICLLFDDLCQNCALSLAAHPLCTGTHFG